MIITDEHPASSYGQPVVVMDGGLTGATYSPDIDQPVSDGATRPVTAQGTVGDHPVTIISWMEYNEARGQKEVVATIEGVGTIRESVAAIQRRKG